MKILETILVKIICIRNSLHHFFDWVRLSFMQNNRCRLFNARSSLEIYTIYLQIIFFKRPRAHLFAYSQMFRRMICLSISYSHIMYMHAESKRRHNKDERHSSLEKYSSHLIERVVCERELETEQNCNILTPTLFAITKFLSRSSGLLNRGPGGPSSLVHVPQSSIFSPTDSNFLCTELYYCFMPTQSLPVTGQRNMQLPPSLEWYVLNIIEWK